MCETPSYALRYIEKLVSETVNHSAAEWGLQSLNVASGGGAIEKNDDMSTIYIVCGARTEATTKPKPPTPASTGEGCKFTGPSVLGGLKLSSQLPVKSNRMPFIRSREVQFTVPRQFAFGTQKAHGLSSVDKREPTVCALRVFEIDSTGGDPNHLLIPVTDLARFSVIDPSQTHQITKKIRDLKVGDNTEGKLYSWGAIVTVPDSSINATSQARPPTKCLYVKVACEYLRDRRLFPGLDSLLLDCVKPFPFANYVRSNTKPNSQKAKSLKSKSLAVHPPLTKPVPTTAAAAPKPIAQPAPPPAPNPISDAPAPKPQRPIRSPSPETGVIDLSNLTTQSVAAPAPPPPPPPIPNPPVSRLKLRCRK